MNFRYHRSVAALTGLLVTLAVSVTVAQTPLPQAAASPAAVQNPVVKEAQQRASEGKHADALELYRKALAADPKLFDAHLGVGQMLDMLGKYEEARQQLMAAIELASPATRDQARTAMAVSYAFESKAADAGKYYEQVFNDRVAAANFNGAAATANAMARVYLESGDVPNAEKWYRTGYETSKTIKDLTPAQSDLWQMRWLHAQARVAARRGNAPDARAHATAMKTLLDKGENENERPQHQYLLGYLALEAGEFDTAVAELQKANLDDSFVVGLLAQAYEKKGDGARAAEYHNKALASRAHSLNTAFSRLWATKYLKK
ncbi:MAG: tetratricopeptide repeat protein [Vicinamibacterales bacterium]